MSDRPQTHYLNADFDLALRPRPRQIEQPKLVRQVRELSVQAVLGADVGDAALLRAEVPREFTAHLEAHDVTVPRLLRQPRIDPGATFRPFGWSREAIELNERHERPAVHPDLPCVRRVNSRSFARRIEQELFPEGAPPGSEMRSVAELEGFLARALPSSEWVIKSEFGHAALANRRLRRPRLAAADRRWVDRRLAEDDRMIVEPWLRRERDCSAVFEVPFDASSWRLHETVYTGDGAPIGALFEPGVQGLAAWSEQLARASERIAVKLRDEGYFGPVCVDAFVWRDGHRSRLRALVDLNGRLAMSDCAYRLWQRMAPERTLYYRFFNRRKLALPSGLPRTLAALGDRDYDPVARRGILLASPLELALDGTTWRPARLAVSFVAADRREVLALESWFRRRFEA